MRLTGVYATAFGEAAWSEDLLHARVLPHGASGMVRLSGLNGTSDVGLRLVPEGSRDRLKSAPACGKAGLRLAPWQP